MWRLLIAARISLLVVGAQAMSQAEKDPLHEKSRWVYHGAVFEIEKEIPDNS